MGIWYEVNRLKIIRNAILIFLSLTLIFLLPINIFLHSLHITIMKPYQTANYLEQSGIYENLDGYIKRIIIKNTDHINQAQGKAIVNRIVNNFAESEITTYWIASKITIAQRHLWDFILERTERVEPIPMQDFRDAFVEIGKAQIKKIANAEGLPANILNDEILSSIEKNIPSSYDFASLYMKQLKELRNVYQKFQKGLYLLYIVNLIAFLLGAIITIQSKLFFRWTGITLTVAGVISIIPGTIKFILNERAIGSILTFSGELEQIKSSIYHVIEVMIYDLIAHIAAYSLTLLGIGGLSLVIYLITKNKKKTYSRYM